MYNLPYKNSEAEKHFLAVKDIIQKRAQNILKSGIKNNKVKLVLSVELKNYLKSLLVDTGLKALIVSKPEHHLNIIKTMRKISKNFCIEGTVEHFVLDNLFIKSCYNNKKFDKLNFIKGIGIETCPYCNRSYISYLVKKDKIKPQIDHFFPQTKYPFLGVTYYNLIPSCETCNGLHVKGAIDPQRAGLVNPYLILRGNFKFRYKILSPNFLNPLKDKSSVEVSFANSIQGHLKVFKLDKLYEQHSDHVIELIVKSKIEYSKKYRDYLNNYDGLSFSDDEIDRMILGTYPKEEDIHKRPLTLLYQDIGKSLGLIKG